MKGVILTEEEFKHYTDLATDFREEVEKKTASLKSDWMIYRSLQFLAFGLIAGIFMGAVAYAIIYYR